MASVGLHSKGKGDAYYRIFKLFINEWPTKTVFTVTFVLKIRPCSGTEEQDLLKARPKLKSRPRIVFPISCCSCCCSKILVRPGP